jgi:hypothetical protein
VRVPLGDDSREGARTVQVRSSDGVTTYLVRCLPGGLWTCTCADSAHRQRQCKHIRHVRSLRGWDDIKVEGGEL